MEKERVLTVEEMKQIKGGDGEGVKYMDSSGVGEMVAAFHKDP